MTDGLFLGPLLLRWNGLLMALGISMGALLAAREAKQRNYDPAIIFHLFSPLLLWGTVGARIWYILTPPLSSLQLGLTTYYYLSHPVDAVAVWLGGFGIPGAWVGGCITLLFFTRKNKLPLAELTDILAPGLALAQSVGRLGNYFNQELYGLPTNLPWRIFIEPAYRLGGYETTQYFHPLFAYEAILNIGNAILLLWLSKRLSEKLRKGDLFLVYLGVYSICRFLLEYLRIDVALVHGINVNQVFFAIIFVGTGVGLYLRHRPAQEL